MLLKDRIAAHGTSMFRWRSYLPLILIFPLLIALDQTDDTAEWLGETLDDLWEIFGICLAFAGAAIRLATVGLVPAGTSGRNTAEQRADCLNTTGLYSIVRNPLYIGNGITLLGFSLVVEVWWLVPLVAGLALFYYERIIYTEEAFLLERFGNEYEFWAMSTPALVPKFRQWRRPELPFSVSGVVRRDYHGLYLIVVVLTLIELADSLLADGLSITAWAREDSGWAAFFATGTITYASIRFIRKNTQWLTVPSS